MGGWNKKVVDLAGQKIGKWEILRRSDESTANGSQAWVCRCECGTEKPVSQPYLLSGASTMCTTCAHRPLPFLSGEVPYPYWRDVNLGAIKRNLEVTISSQEAYTLLERQEFKCALSGVPIQLPVDGNDSQSASLDRINSGLGYIKDNIQWVHRDVNYMKNGFSTDYFVNFCRLIASANPEVPNIEAAELSLELPQIRNPSRGTRLTNKQVREAWEKTGLYRGYKARRHRKKYIEIDTE